MKLLSLPITKPILVLTFTLGYPWNVKIQFLEFDEKNMKNYSPIARIQPSSSEWEFTTLP